MELLYALSDLGDCLVVSRKSSSFKELKAKFAALTISKIEYTQRFEGPPPSESENGNYMNIYRPRSEQ